MLATNEKKKILTLGKPKAQTCQPHLAHELTNLQSQFNVLENVLLLKPAAMRGDSSKQNKGGGVGNQLQKSGDNKKSNPVVIFPGLLEAICSDKPDKKSQES